MTRTPIEMEIEENPVFKQNKMMVNQIIENTNLTSKPIFTPTIEEKELDDNEICGIASHAPLCKCFRNPSKPIENNEIVEGWEKMFDIEFPQCDCRNNMAPHFEDSKVNRNWVKNFISQAIQTALQSQREKMVKKVEKLRLFEYGTVRMIDVLEAIKEME